MKMSAYLQERVRRMHERAAVAMRRQCHRQRAADQTEVAGQRQFTGEFELAQPLAGQLSGRNQNADRDQQVEAAGFLW